jgi:hypothetical protein
VGRQVFETFNHGVQGSNPCGLTIKSELGSSTRSRTGVAADQKEAPLPGLKEGFSTSKNLAVLLLPALLSALLTTLARLLVRLLLLLAGLLPAAALLTTLAALLVLLILRIAFFGHQITPWFNIRNNAALS